MANERKTEDLVEARLREQGYYGADSGVVVEKQASDNARIRRLLKTASKAGKENPGYPEFFIHSPAYPDFLVVVECKASASRHESPGRDRPVGFAVDGVLHYASFLAKDYDVLAIAISGETEAKLQISHFLHLRGTAAPLDWDEAADIVPLDDYYDAFIKTDAKFREDYGALLDFSRKLNVDLQAAKITEAQRGFLISGILIALENDAFKKSFRAHKTAMELANSLVNTIKTEFDSAKLPQDRQEVVRNAFSFIMTSPALTKDRDFAIALIESIDDNINAFMRTHEFYDTIGQFYIEFLRYANNDKGLGIVLTPHHIAQLFAELADVRPESIVFDNCCGTAGLLIAAMKRMVEEAGIDKALQKKIRTERLIGIEYQPQVYALAASNMILHGDGKTKLYQGDCFEPPDSLFDKGKPSVGLLNPPYKNKQSKDDREELEFIFNNLEKLRIDGTCVAIVPITVATAPSGAIGEWKRALLDKHTLEAVMSMPIGLFHNSNTTVVTCIMVFTAGRPHPKGKKTWFGYWRNDGLIKTKNRGRFDGDGVWPAVLKHWTTTFRNRDILKGESVAREVDWSDEWCAEAYLEPDYEAVDQDALAQAAKRSLLARLVLSNELPAKGADDV